ncbi:hypothetical protein BC831DRAFT_456864 [Entophlyctis helioformis]|nr:hypothetical protein BC831DRAFT_456864 [Entophlyctis helioformis]
MDMDLSPVATIDDLPPLSRWCASLGSAACAPPGSASGLHRPSSAAHTHSHSHTHTHTQRRQLSEAIVSNQLRDQVMLQTANWPIIKYGYLTRRNVTRSDSHNAAAAPASPTRAAGSAPGQHWWSANYVEVRGLYMFFYLLLDVERTSGGSASEGAGDHANDDPSKLKSFLNRLGPAAHGSSRASMDLSRPMSVVFHSNLTPDADKSRILVHYISLSDAILAVTDVGVADASVPRTTVARGSADYMMLVPKIDGIISSRLNHVLLDVIVPRDVLEMHWRLRETKYKHMSKPEVEEQIRLSEMRDWAMAISVTGGSVGAAELEKLSPVERRRSPSPSLSLSPSPSPTGRTSSSSRMSLDSLASPWKRSNNRASHLASSSTSPTRGVKPSSPPAAASSASNADTPGDQHPAPRLGFLGSIKRTSLLNLFTRRDASAKTAEPLTPAAATLAAVSEKSSAKQSPASTLFSATPPRSGANSDDGSGSTSIDSGKMDMASASLDQGSATANRSRPFANAGVKIRQSFATGSSSSSATASTESLQRLAKHQELLRKHTTQHKQIQRQQEDRLHRKELKNALSSPQLQPPQQQLPVYVPEIPLATDAAIRIVPSEPTLVFCDEQEKDRIPPIIVKCLSAIEDLGLDTEGLYRVSGSSAVIDRLRAQFESDPDGMSLAVPASAAAAPAAEDALEAAVAAVTITHASATPYPPTRLRAAHRRRPTRRHRTASALSRAGSRSRPLRTRSQVSFSPSIRERRQPPQYNLELFDNDINVLCSLVKLVLRNGLGDNQEPLCTFALYKTFMRAGRIEDTRTRLVAIQDTVHMLPDSHFAILELLCKHLSTIAAHCDATRMTPQNLAIVFAPTLFREPPDFKQTLTPREISQRVVQDMPIQCAIVETMIAYALWLFEPKATIKRGSSSGSGSGGGAAADDDDEALGLRLVRRTSSRASSMDSRREFKLAGKPGLLQRTLSAAKRQAGAGGLTSPAPSS